MSFNKQSAEAYAMLGANFFDRWKLWSCGLIVPQRDKSSERRWQLFSRLVPKVWLKPGRLKGLKLLIDPTDWSQTVIFEEVFLHSSYDMRKVKFSPKVIIDCGAHIGLFSLLAKSTFPQAAVVAYEPNPQNAEYVRSQISKNGLDISLNEKAVSTESKELEFVAINSHGGRLKGHSVDGIKEDSANRYTVKTIDLYTELKTLQPDSLLIKMDIEGEERVVMPKILPLLPRQTAIFFETHAGDAGWKEMEQLLISNGFQVENLTARGLYYDGFASRG
jgi:FkbM family methyltransferase